MTDTFMHTTLTCELFFFGHCSSMLHIPIDPGVLELRPPAGAFFRWLVRWLVPSQAVLPAASPTTRRGPCPAHLPKFPQAFSAKIKTKKAGYSLRQGSDCWRQPRRVAKDAVILLACHLAEAIGQTRTLFFASPHTVHMDTTLPKVGY